MTDRHQDAKISQHLWPGESERSHSRSLPGLSLSLWLLVGASAQKLPEASGAAAVSLPQRWTVSRAEAERRFSRVCHAFSSEPRSRVACSQRHAKSFLKATHSTLPAAPLRHGSVWAPGSRERSAGCVPKPLSARAPPACRLQVCAHGGSVRGAGKHRLGELARSRCGGAGGGARLRLQRSVCNPVRRHCHTPFCSKGQRRPASCPEAVADGGSGTDTELGRRPKQVRSISRTSFPPLQPGGRDQPRRR